MHSPFIAPWAEKPHDPPSVRIDRREIGPFGQIALRAGQGQIFSLVTASMLPRPNVLDVKAQL